MSEEQDVMNEVEQIVELSLKKAEKELLDAITSAHLAVNWFAEYKRLINKKLQKQEERIDSIERKIKELEDK